MAEKTQERLQQAINLMLLSWIGGAAYVCGGSMHWAVDEKSINKPYPVVKVSHLCLVLYVWRTGPCLKRKTKSPCAIMPQLRKSVRPHVATQKPKRALRLMLLGLDCLFQSTQDLQ